MLVVGRAKNNPVCHYAVVTAFPCRDTPFYKHLATFGQVFDQYLTLFAEYSDREVHTPLFSVADAYSKGCVSYIAFFRGFALGITGDIADDNEFLVVNGVSPPLPIISYRILLHREGRSLRI